MKIIICEEDYTFIEVIHSTLSKYAKLKGINAEFNLTTRKTASIERFLKREVAECYYISLNLESDMSGIELIKLIRSKNPQAIIVALGLEESDFKNEDLKELNIYSTILKSETTKLKDALKTSFAKVYRELKTSDFSI